MSFISRLFGHRNPKPPVIRPNDDHMTRRVKEAKWKNARAVSSFVEAAEKQERDANLARQVIHDVLQRAELKATQHVGNNKK